VVRRGAFALALLLCVSSLRAQQPPRPSFTTQNGVVAAALPASVLQHAAVRKQLGSGLTTTFLLVARLREPKSVTGARIEVRYDLWDEVWIVKRIEFDGHTDRQRLTSSEALERWWRAPVRILASNADRVSLQLDLNVLPFSAAEEQDAREWITKSGGGAAVGGGGALVDALIGTTLSAKPITSYRWNVELALQ
jgi:hypothetical protein